MSPPLWVLLGARSCGRCRSGDTTCGLSAGACRGGGGADLQLPFLPQGYPQLPWPLTQLFSCWDSPHNPGMGPPLSCT